MSRNVKISLGMVVLAIAVALLAANSGGGNDDPEVRAAAEAPRDERLVRADSQRLEAPAASKATFVEFLDFECESCRAAYPAIEQLRQTYGDRVTFVVRYMPLHNNSEAAARAAEAAAAQDKFEEMYDKLFETQEEWGEKQDSQEKVFFGFAEDLGLDMARFRQTYDDPATLSRVRRDKADGQALGVNGTPTFFLDGKKLEIESYDDLVQRIEAAAAS